MIQELLSFAHQVADASGAILREHTYGPRRFDTKSDKSPVTKIDMHVEQTIRTLIQQRYPEHGIVGEEFDASNSDAEYVWVIDPIDGTKAFVTGIPVYGTLICVARNGVPVVGIIDQPVTNDRWAGAEGEVSTFNRLPIQCRQTADLSEALVSCSNPESFGTREQEAFDALRNATKWRVYGGSCYAYGCIASGLIDIGIDCGGHRPVDYCAIVPIINGAGGLITDWEGRPLDLFSGNRLIAAGNPGLHAEALRILHQHAPAVAE